MIYLFFILQILFDTVNCSPLFPFLSPLSLLSPINPFLPSTNTSTTTSLSPNPNPLTPPLPSASSTNPASSNSDPPGNKSLTQKPSTESQQKSPNINQERVSGSQSHDNNPTEFHEPPEQKSTSKSETPERKSSNDDSKGKTGRY